MAILMRDLPALLEKRFGKNRIYVSMFVDPIQNPALGVNFIREDGSVVNRTTVNKDCSYLFYQPLEGAFYDLALFAFSSTYPRPLARLSSRHPLFAIGISAKGELFQSAHFGICSNAKKIEDFTTENGIQWCDFRDTNHDDVHSEKFVSDFNGEKYVSFKRLTDYVQWLKTQTT